MNIKNINVLEKKDLMNLLVDHIQLIKKQSGLGINLVEIMMNAHSLKRIKIIPIQEVDVLTVTVKCH